MRLWVDTQVMAKATAIISFTFFIGLLIGVYLNPKPMRLYFWIPLPLSLHVMELRKRNLAYYKMNGHRLYVLIHRSLPFAWVLTLIDKDTQAYFAAVQKIRAEKSLAFKKLQSALKDLAALVGADYKQTFAEKAEPQPEVQQESNLPSKFVRTQAPQGSFNALDVHENDLTDSAVNRLENDRSTSHKLILPVPDAEPTIEIIQKEVHGSPLKLFFLSGAWVTAITILAMLGEMAVLNHVLNLVFKLPQNFRFTVPVVHIAVVFSKVTFMAFIIPVVSALLGIVFHKYTLDLMRGNPNKLFKRLMFGLLAAICLIFFCSGGLFSENVNRENNLKKTLVLSNQLSTLRDNEGDSTQIQSIAAELTKRQGEATAENGAYKVVQLILISTYSALILAIVSMLSAFAQIISLRDRLLKQAQKATGSITKAYRNELSVQQAFAIHQGLVYEIRLRIHKVIILTNQYFHQNKKR